MRPVPHIAAQHVGDSDFGEIYVGDVAESIVIEVFREAGVPAARDENLGLRRRSGGRGLVMGGGEGAEERGFEVRPLSVPLERVVAASDPEEVVPVLFAGEVP